MKIKLIISILTILIIQGYKSDNAVHIQEPRKTEYLSLEQAGRLASLPLACLQTAYPNKVEQVLGSKEDLGEPHMLHPAFYGCFDWHSAVHAHWSLVKLLKMFPHLEEAPEIKQKLQENISAFNIMTEVRYFYRKGEASFERTYGWAWLLKLAEELHSWDDPLGRELEKNLQPLTDLIVDLLKDFLPKLTPSGWANTPIPPLQWPLHGTMQQMLGRIP